MSDPPPKGPDEAAAHATSSASSAPRVPEVAVADDSDPDFDDLDDVLDQFSAATSTNPPAQIQSKPPPAISGPGRPEDISRKPADVPVPQGPKPSESEEEFMSRLTTEMSNMMSKMAENSNISDQPSAEDLAKMGSELEDFTHKMEAQGIKPEDLLKAILGEETGRRLSDAAKEESDRSAVKAGSSGNPSASKATKNFDDTIRKTMERMEDSSAKATSATKESSSRSAEEDMIAEMLKALESEAGGAGEGDLSKMFLGMMEQLTNKDMLYEPMKELNDRFPTWLKENKSKISAADLQRYNKQKEIVNEIVAKFEESSFSDDDPKCREYIWDRMQKMQEQGAPPADLISNPLPGMGMAGEGLGDLPDEGCPTQ